MAYLYKDYYSAIKKKWIIDLWNMGESPSNYAEWRKQDCSPPPETVQWFHFYKILEYVNQFRVTVNKSGICLRMVGAGQGGLRQRDFQGARGNFQR